MHFLGRFVGVFFLLPKNTGFQAPYLCQKHREEITPHLMHFLGRFVGVFLPVTKKYWF
jgi:hypothetical protein